MLERALVLAERGVDPSDAPVRRASLALVVEQPGVAQHVGEVLQRLAGPPQDEADIADVVQRLDLGDGVVEVEQRDPVLVEARRLLVGVARPRPIAGVHEAEGGPARVAPQLVVLAQVLELGLGAVRDLGLQPLRGEAVVLPLALRVEHLADQLALQVVLEGVLGRVGDRRVGQQHQVVALDQAVEQLLDHLLQDVRHPEVRLLGHLLLQAAEADQRLQPEDAPQHRRLLKHVALGRGEGGDARVHRLLDGHRQLDLIHARGVHKPVLAVDADAAVVDEQPDQLLHEEGIATGHVRRALDQIRRKVLGAHQQPAQQLLALRPRER